MDTIQATKKKLRQIQITGLKHFLKNDNMSDGITSHDVWYQNHHQKQVGIEIVIHLVYIGYLPMVYCYTFSLIPQNRLKGFKRF